jgi:hypothetical protein
LNTENYDDYNDDDDDMIVVFVVVIIIIIIIVIIFKRNLDVDCLKIGNSERFLWA